MPRALAASAPILLLSIGGFWQAAHAAVDLAAKVSVELVAKSHSAGGGLQDFVVRDGGVLRTGDGLQLRLESEAEAYVYIIAYGSSNTAVLLHPFSAKPDDALIRKGQREVIPEPGVFLPLDGREGRETLFTIGSDVPVTGLAELLARIESHGDNLTAISAMLAAEFPLSRRLTFKHIGASPLLGVTATATRSPAGEDSPASGSHQPDVAGAGLAPPAGGGWSVPSAGGFAASDAPGAAAAAPKGTATASTEPAAPATAPRAVPPAKAATPAATTAKTSTSTSTPAKASPTLSAAQRKAREAAGIDESQFRGILATLPASGDANVPAGMQKTFTEQGVLAAEGSRIRALERAQNQSGTDWPGTQGGSEANTQN